MYDEYEGDDNQEHKYIKDIANVLINRENILLLDQYIEEIFPYSKLPSFDKASNGFIKIPLWDFPFIKGLSYLELKYTKEELKQILVPFKSGLKELSEQLSVLSYSEDNFTQIEQIVKDKILNDIAPIQLSINESLYLCKLRNQQGDKSKFKLCLGISSAENIVSFYEKAEILLPYVANETKQNLIKHMDINTCSVFMYYEIHYPDPE